MSLLDDINSKFMVHEVVNGKLLEKVRNLLILNDLSTSNLDENVNDLIVSKTTDIGVIGQYKKDRNKLVYSDDSSYYSNNNDAAMELFEVLFAQY